MPMFLFVRCPILFNIMLHAELKRERSWNVIGMHMKKPVALKILLKNRFLIKRIQLRLLYPFTKTKFIYFGALRDSDRYLYHEIASNLYQW